MVNPKTQFAITARGLKLGESHADLPKVRGYLERFGYLRIAVPKADPLDAATIAAITAFQRRHGLPPTGTIDNATARKMEMPRCGLPDVPPGDKDESAPYVLRGCSYQGTRRTLTFGFVNSTPDLAGDTEREAIQRALTTWSSATNVDFREVSLADSPVVTFGWFSANHGDGSSFDGPGTVIAHAFYPPPCGGANAGKCHFDEAEDWAISANQGIDLETVGLHELGHILGLAHSNVFGSVMYPYYGGELRALSADDVAGIQQLYGRPGLALRVRVHLQGIGDRTSRDNEFNGTRGQYRRLEGFQLEIATNVPNLSCRYKAHLQGIGDTAWVNEGQFVGTRGEDRRLEGFAIELTGTAAAAYSVKYMAHLQGTGDTNLTADGQFCGTRGQSWRVEGMLVRIEPRQ